MVKSTKYDEAGKSMIIQSFPLISKIKDLKVQEKVIEVWSRICRESRLHRIERTPVDRDDIFTLVRHTNVTAELSLTMAEKIMQEYGISINLDNVIAIAILHDVDQILLRKKIGNTLQATELEKKIPHGVYGGHIALEVGLSPEIAHGIMFHRQTMEPATVEAVIVKYCDNANFLAYSISAGW